MHGSMSLQQFLMVWIFVKFLGVISSDDGWVLSEIITKITSRIGVSWMDSLPFWFWPRFNSMKWLCYQKKHKQDNFESCNSLKLIFTNIEGLFSNFIQCKSFLESNCPDILGLCEAHLDDSIDSGNFSVRGYLPLIWKDSVTLCMFLQFMWSKDFLLHRTHL